MVDKKGEYVCPRCDLGIEKKNVASTIRKKLNQFFQIEEKDKDKDKPEPRERRETVTSTTTTVNNNNQLTPPTTSDDRSVSSVDEEESVSSPRRSSDQTQSSSSAANLASSKKHLPPLPLPPKKKDKEKDKPKEKPKQGEKDEGSGKPAVPPKSNRKSMVISAQKIRALFTPRGKDKSASPPQLDLTRVEKSSSPSDDEDSISGSARRSFSGSDDPER